MRAIPADPSQVLQSKSCPPPRPFFCYLNVSLHVLWRRRRRIIPAIIGLPGATWNQNLSHPRLGGWGEPFQCGTATNMQAVHSELLSLPLLFVLEELTLPVCRLPCFRPPCSSLHLRRLRRDLRGKLPPPLVLFSSALLPFPSPQHPLGGGGGSRCDSAQKSNPLVVAPAPPQSACPAGFCESKGLFLFFVCFCAGRQGSLHPRCHQLSPNKLTQQTY